MARRKDKITQKDFSLGQVRREALERDDTDVLSRSLREAKNCISLVPGPLESRSGTVFVSTNSTAQHFDVDLGGTNQFILKLQEDGLEIEDQSGATVTSFGGAPWDGSEDIWVLSDTDTKSVLIGAESFAARALVLDQAGLWSFGTFAYANAPGGALAQPYWNFASGVTITPSGRTGAITVTASDAIFEAGHVGTRIRYDEREIEINVFLSGTMVSATVLQELAPTYEITVSSASGFLMGQAVEEEINGGRGLITGIAGNIITVLVTANWDGFNAANDLVGPDSKSNITNVSAPIAPAASFLWDEPLQSPVRGYAGSAAKHTGRLILCHFAQAPLAAAISAAGLINDFKTGINDGDAIVESIGTGYGGSLLHAVSAEDLLFLTSSGVYYQETRSGQALTPAAFNPVRFDGAGCNAVRPAVVDDGIVFVGKNGNNISAAILAGDIYRAWSIEPLTPLHATLIKEPVSLSAPSDDSDRPERFIYVVNSDGTAAVMRWVRENNEVGWFPWETAGAFKKMLPAFGQIYAVVEREIAAVTSIYFERFDTNTRLDCAGSVPHVGAGAVHLDGHIAALWIADWDLGDFTINANGRPVDDLGAEIALPDLGATQAGLPFSLRVVPWSRRSVESYRGKRAVKREIEMLISIQDSITFAFEGKPYGGYNAGDDLLSPPARREEQARFVLSGRKGYPKRPITLDRPGLLRITQIATKVAV